MLEDKTISTSLDGRSNVHDDPIICAIVMTLESAIFLIDTVDMEMLTLLIIVRSQSIQWIPMMKMMDCF